LGGTDIQGKEVIKMTEDNDLRNSDGERPDVFRYSALIRYAKLLKNEKHLLRFYADVHNWKTNRWSEYSTHRICSLVSMSPKTFREARRNLENLGWIAVHQRGDRTAPTIELKIGRNDLRYDKKEYAAWWLPEGGYSEEFSGNPFESVPSMGVEEQVIQMELMSEVFDEDLDQQFKDSMLAEGMTEKEFRKSHPEIERDLRGKRGKTVSFKPFEKEESNSSPSDDGLRVSSLSEW
jgi:hypothetical protein